jgi:signal transduction histidine kinase
LDAIRATSISSLDELRRVLHTDAPQPGLQDLPVLVERASDAGVHVGLHCTDAAEVPATAGANAYRMVRDSLTNVLRHAETTEVTVAVERCREGLQVTVTADGTAPRAGRAGSGSDVSPVRGVIEAAGGVLTAGPAEGGGFRVAAYIPWTGGA